MKVSVPNKEQRGKAKTILLVIVFTLAAGFMLGAKYEQHNAAVLNDAVRSAKASAMNEAQLNVKK